MSDTNFSMIFSGKAVEDGEIDIDDFASSLIEFNKVIQEANHFLYRDKSSISVRVKATRRGSFIVDFTLLHIQPFWGKALALLSHDKEIISVAALITILFGSDGLFKGLKFLKGKLPKEIEKMGNKINIYNYWGENYMMNREAYRLYENPKIRKSINKFISPIKENSIDTISVITKIADEDNTIIFDKKDVQNFRELLEIKEEIHDEIRLVTLQVIALNFKKGQRWKFSNGEVEFFAAIEDDNFMTSVLKDERQFSRNDYLVCKVREQQLKTADGLKIERTIIEVLEHQKSAMQLEFSEI